MPRAGARFNRSKGEGLPTSGSFDACLAFPADHGRCGDQDSQIVLESRLACAFGPVEGAPELPDASVHALALACFLTLLHRHTNQPSVCVGWWSRGSGLRLASCEFEDHTLLTDVLASLEQAPCGAVAAASADPFLPTVFGFCSRQDTDAATRIASLASLSLALIDDDTTATVRLTFDGQLFRAERMQEFLDQFQMLVAQAFALPHSRVLDYSLITALGQRLLPDPSVPIIAPRYPLLSEVFAEIAAAQPNDVAVSQAGQSWTYAQLERGSAEIAMHLCSIGVQPGDVVAVSGPRSFGVVSAVLSVFRSGATLLTIDPKLPLERQSIMLRQAGARYLLRVGPPAQIDASIATVIKVEPATGGMPDVPARRQPGPDLPALDPVGAAYIFFTSGSTGTPKGVVGTHQGLAHFLDWQRKTFEIGSGDRAAQITTLSFDMVLRDMFLALTSGATLCIPQEADVLDPAAILNWMAAERISVLHVVPSLLRAWINHAPPNLRLPCLRRVFLAGEPLTEALILSFRAAFGTAALLTNFYGPTETTLIKCFHPVLDVEPGLQPIGRPQPQTQILILNRCGQLCGVHEIGQIAIRTPFRTLGYLNAPEATAGVFVPNPFRADAQDKLYLTGDSGCYRTDGLLVMCGRMDDQVKIRGMRVEPAEIEAEIGRYPGIREAAVVAHENSSGSKYLAAYIVVLSTATDPSSTSTPGALVGEFLRARLPGNMVPAVFVVLDALPLLPNGKVNKKALKASAPPPVHAQAAEGALDGPRNSLEAELLAIWRNVLGHERVGVNDSFVEMGGDSLMAISALVRMQRMGISDAFSRGIFQGWSIRQISEMADGHSGSADAMTLPPKVKTNLFVNVLRGIMVIILVTGHWFEGLLNRLPESWHGAHEVMMPLFNVATPGFAILFGLTLGYVYFPRYQTDRDQAARTLRLGALLVFSGVLLRSGMDNATALLSGEVIDATLFFNTFYSAILYYAIALLTAPFWFRLILKSTQVYRTILLMMLTSYLLYQLALWLFLEHEQQGFIQLCRLMLVAKFNYFNMSVGALGGLAAGVYLHRWSLQKLPLHELSARLAVSGGAAVACGLVLLYAATGSFAAIHDAAIMPVWKWVFYAGTLLLSASLLSLALSVYEQSSMPVRVSANILGVLGQISLPVFVFHNMVLQFKALLISWGMASVPALILPLGVFLAGCAWMMWRLYRLYYGAIGERQAPLARVELSL